MIEVWASDVNHDCPFAKVKNIKAGDVIWVSTDNSSDVGYEPARVVGRIGCSIKFSRVSMRGIMQYETINLKEVQRKDRPFVLRGNPREVDDLTQLQYLNKPSIVHTLETRVKRSQPYTFIGNVLIVVNPLHHIDEDSFCSGVPHPATLAEAAYDSMSLVLDEYERVVQNSEGYQKLCSDKTRSFTEEKVLLDDILEKKRAVEKRLGHINQMIVISGESGAGKTEAAKRVLLGLLNKEGYGEVDVNAISDYETFEDHVLGSNPILESFGNATTKKNPNSSRFGRCLNLYFEPDVEYTNTYNILGASIDVYLLEVNRVVCPEAGEKNFRIFYQLLTSPNEKLHKLLGFAQAGEKFKYLGNKKFSLKESDREGYVELRIALRMLDLKIRNLFIFQVVAAILHLGNIEFQEKSGIAVIDDLKAPLKPESKHDPFSSSNFTATELSKTMQTLSPPSSFISLASLNDEGQDLLEFNRANYSPLYFASRLLGLNLEDLHSALTTKSVKAGAQSLKAALHITQASTRRDALAKALYSSLFSWLVNKINETMNQPLSAQRQVFQSKIGILDIFGFEDFAENGLNQLLINYANEVLLKKFLQDVIVSERAIYKDEDLTATERPNILVSESVSAMKENTRCIELLCPKQGVLRTIHDFSIMPKSSTTAMLSQIQRKLTNHGDFEVLSKLKDSNKNFVIQHYVAAVKYTSRNLIKRNTLHRLGDDIIGLLKDSSHSIVSQLTFNFGRNQTSSSIFYKQMKALSKELEASSCRYIRCVKPNPTLYFNQKAFEMELENSNRKLKYDAVAISNRKYLRRLAVPKHRFFDRDYVSKQLQALGIYSCVEVLKHGYPNRIPYEDFFKLYYSIIPIQSITYFKEKPEAYRAKMYICALMSAFRINRDSYKLGATQIFFRNEKFQNIRIVINSFEEFGNKARRHKLEQRFREFYKKKSLKLLVIKIRAFSHFIRKLKVYRATLRIQVFLRKQLFVGQVQSRIQRRRAAVLIQKIFRGYLAKGEYLRRVKQREERIRGQVIMLDTRSVRLSTFQSDLTDDVTVIDFPNVTFDSPNENNALTPRIKAYFKKRSTSYVEQVNSIKDKSLQMPKLVMGRKVSSKASLIEQRNFKKMSSQEFKTVELDLLEVEGEAADETLIDDVPMISKNSSKKNTIFQSEHSYKELMQQKKIELRQLSSYMLKEKNSRKSSKGLLPALKVKKSIGQRQKGSKSFVNRIASLFGSSAKQREKLRGQERSKVFKRSSKAAKEVNPKRSNTNED